MNSLSVVPAVEKAVNPKPTKNEIIEALVLLTKKQQGEAYAEAKARKEKSRERAKALLEKHFRKVAKTSPLRVTLGGVYNDRLKYVSVEVEFDNLPPDVESALRACHAPLPACESEKDIRRKIRLGADSIQSKSDRVKALLETPDSRKALEAMLSSLGMNSQKIIEA